MKRDRFNIAGFNGQALSAREMADFKLSELAYTSGQKLPQHSHEKSYFSFTLAGSYDEQYGRRTKRCRSLTLAFHPAGAAHSVTFGNSEARTFNVEIPPRWMKRFQEFDLKLDEPAYCQGGPAAWLAQRLYNEYLNLDPWSALVVEGLLLEIAAETTRSCKATGAAKVPPWLNTAKQMVHDNLAQTLSLKEIAAAVNVNPVYLANSFRKHYGTTIGNYVRRLRVDFACRQILDTDHSLTQIAVNAGFFDQSHFSKTFKRFVGMPPSIFHQRYGRKG